MQVLCEITHYYIFYRQLSPPLCCEEEGVFTNKQYRLGCSISIKMASQPCGGTTANKPTQCVHSQLVFTHDNHSFCIKHIEFLMYSVYTWNYDKGAIIAPWYIDQLIVNLSFVCLSLTSLLNMWGHIAAVPACSSDTLTNVLPHTNAMP